MPTLAPDLVNATFPYGVASGDLTADSIVLWTRVVPGSGDVEWWCEPVSGGERHVGERRSGTAAADPTTGSVHVLVDRIGGVPQYRYGFVGAGAASPEGLFKTLPTDRPARFAVVCCAKFNSGFFNAYRALAEMDDIDFVLHLGDYIYEAAEVPVGKQTPGANIGRPMDPLGTCVTYADYDTRYREYRGDQDLLLLHSRHAIIATIDDHELADNAWEGGADEHDLARDGTWSDRKKAAMDVWQDWMPTMRRPLDGGTGAGTDENSHIWQEISLGEAGRILLCETRLARTDPAGPDGSAKTELGTAQRDWLMSALETPVPGWTFLAVPSMLASVEEAATDPDALFALRKLKLTDADAVDTFHDLWGVFGTEKAELLQAVHAAERTIVLSGDVHFSAEHISTPDGNGFVEWTSTSITSPNLDDKMGWPRGAESRDYEAALLKMLPDLQWCDLDSHGFMVVGAEPQSASCQWWFVDTVRELSDVSVMGHAVVIPAHPVGESQG
ncbi:MAG: alkaline phosphatase D family protein [Pseudolysinimonas sp.]